MIDTVLPVGYSVDEALRLVGEMREAERASKFPHLIPVHPQPAMAFAVCIALPAWCEEQ